MKIPIKKLTPQETEEHNRKVMYTIGIGSVMDLAWYHGYVISPTLPSSYMTF